ncbi:glycosyltransferase family 39 protein [bacterium]|nr:glycosyltransferase family 39 protein [bacterium]
MPIAREWEEADRRPDDSGMDEADLAEGQGGLPLSVIAIVMVIVFGWTLFGWHVAQRGLWSSHEGRAAQNAQSILDDGNWLVPRLFTGEIENQKPPLYYWLVASLGILHDREVDPLCVRLPAAVAGVAGLVVVYLLGQRMWSIETGLAAAGILACTTRYAWLARVGRIDMLLCLVVMLCLYLFWQSADPRGSRRRLSWWVYVLLAVGVLLKGPIAILLFALPVGSYLLFMGEPIFPGLQARGWKTWRELRILPGSALLLAIASPWFIYITWLTGGEFFWSFFVYHNVERAVGSSEALKSGPIWFYIPRLFVDAFPWSILLPVCWVSLWKHREDWLPPGQNRSLQPIVQPQVLFLLCWGVSHFVLLSLVSFKRADYLLPAFPPVALLLAGWLADRTARIHSDSFVAKIRHPRRRRRLIIASAGCLTLLLVPILIWAGIEFQENSFVDSLLKIDLLSDHLNETDRFMMSHVELAMRESWPLLVIGGVVLIVSVWLVHTGWHEGLEARLLVGLGLPWVVGFFFQVHVLLPALDPLREMSRFARAIRAVAGPDTTVYYFGKFDSDLAFHIGRPARAIEDWDELAQLSTKRENCFVVMKASQKEWIQRDPRTAHWITVVDNRKIAFGGHRDHRLLLASQGDLLDPEHLAREMPTATQQ